MNILIVGFGNIGKRHFESIQKLINISEIYLYDTDESKFEKYVFNYKKLKIIKNLSQLEKKIIEYCIVSTSSSPRARIIEELLMKLNIKTFLLEKVLFQTIEDYFLIEKLFILNKVEAFVNCPRRIMPGYLALKKELDGNKINGFEVSGGRWNIASNIIHFFDTLSFLINDDFESIYLDGSGLIGMFKSKREGYFDFYGVITGNFDLIDFKASSFDNDNETIVLIYSDSNTYIINETIGLIKITSNFNTSIIQKEFKIDYVSNTTNKFISDHIISSPSLTNYNHSIRLHIPLVELFICHQNRFSQNSNSNNRANIT